MKRTVSILLALILMLALLPVGAAAAEQTGMVTVTVYYDDDYTDTYCIPVGDAPVTLTHGGFETLYGTVYEFEYYSNGETSITIPAYDGTAKWYKQWGYLAEYYKVHTHSYRQRYDRRQHWMGCACGSWYDKESHVDPAADEDKICTCGYRFSNNCDLTTLWLENMTMTERFQKDKTDYTANVFTYKEVSSTAITAVAFDSLATVELPKDLSLKDGSNVFEIKVTAEDKTTTKTYTVTAVKPVKVAGILITSDASAVTAAPKTVPSRRIATAKVPDLLLEEMAEIAARDGSKQIILEPDFSKWGYDQIDVPLDSGALKRIAADTGADLVVKTHFGTVTVPNADIAALAEGCENLTVSIVKETSIELYADGQEIKELPKTVDRDLY